MLTALVVLALLAVAVAGIYLLLRGMGEDGVEAAAPGSCRSGRCGVPAKEAGVVEEHHVPVDEIKRGGPGKP